MGVLHCSIGEFFRFRFIKAPFQSVSTASMRRLLLWAPELASLPSGGFRVRTWNARLGFHLGEQTPKFIPLKSPVHPEFGDFLGSQFGIRLGKTACRNVNVMPLSVTC